MELDTITYYKIKNDIKLLLSNDQEDEKRLYSRFVSDDFHNNVIMYLNQKIADVQSSYDREVRRDKYAEIDEVIYEYNNLLTSAIIDLGSFMDELSIIYKEETDTPIEDACVEPDYSNYLELFVKQYEYTPAYQQLLLEIYNMASNMYDDMHINGYKSTREDLNILIENLQYEFPFPPMSFDDAILAMNKMASLLEARCEASKSILFSIKSHMRALNKYEHQTVQVPRKNFDQLFITFAINFENLQKTTQNSEQLNADKINFNYKLSLLKLRNDYWKNDKVLINTQELEHYILMPIIAHAPYQMSDFILFLIKNKIVLPLYAHKLPIYFRALVNYDNSTINKAFCVELDDEKIDLAPFRKDVLNKETFEKITKNLIHLPSNIKTK